MILGDLGAEIIKVEEINGGDQTRNIPPYVQGESHYFLAINRNKKSLALDARTPGGRAVLLDLARHCDAVIENFRPGVMERLGLGADALRAVNPRLIICSISGYGQKTSLSGKPSFDLVAQALSGVMSINGEPDGPPTKARLADRRSWRRRVGGHRHLVRPAAPEATGEALTVDLSLLDGTGRPARLPRAGLLRHRRRCRSGSAPRIRAWCPMAASRPRTGTWSSR